MAKITLRNITGENVGRVLNVGEGAEVDADGIYGRNVDDVVFIRDANQDPADALAKLGFRRDTPHEVILELLRDLQVERGAAYGRHAAQLKGSRASAYLADTANFMNVAEGLHGLVTSSQWAAAFSALMKIFGS